MTTQKYQHLNRTNYRKALLAYLMGQGFDEKQSAGQLPSDKSISAAQVARDIGEAEVRRWLITRFAEELFEQELLDELREDAHHRRWLELGAWLRDLSDGTLKSIWVFNSTADFT